MIPSLAWRNVWRNKLRSAVVITAVSLGVFAGIFAMAFTLGMAEQRVKSAIKTEVSHIQIHNPAFLEVSDLKNGISGSDSIMERLLTYPSCEGASRRIIVNAIANSAERGTGIRLIGIEPEKESAVTDLSRKLKEGSYLDPIKRGKPIVIGEKLADKLKLKTGSKLVAGCLDANAQPVYSQFRVGGIYRTTNTAYDEGTAFVDYNDLLELTGLPENYAHEIAIFLNNSENSPLVSNELKNELPDLSVRQWNEIMPELNYLTESMGVYMFIFMLILMLAMGFGIVNTMLMVVLERIREIGMLLAVGMSKKRIFLMIMLETVFLSITGGVIGIFIGSASSLYFAENGLDLTQFYGDGLASFGYDAFVYFKVSASLILTTAIMVILTGIIASVYPALKALRLNPSEALHSE